MDWCYLRHPHWENYQLSADGAILRGTELTLCDVASPTFIGLRQRDFDGLLTVHVKADRGEAGVTAYMTEQEHYDLGIRQTDRGWEAFVRLCIGDVKHIQASFPLDTNEAELQLRMDPIRYHFSANDQPMASAQTKYLSSEVATGFTGVVLGLYATENNTAEFTGFKCEYK